MPSPSSWLKVTIVDHIFKSFVLDVAQWQVEWKQKYHERIFKNFFRKTLMSILCPISFVPLSSLQRRRQWHPTPVLLPGKSMDGGDWWAVVHGVARSRARLRDFTFTFVHWRRKWQPTPVFLLGESQGQGSLVGCHLWGCTESDTTEAT